VRFEVQGAGFREHSNKKNNPAATETFQSIRCDPPTIPRVR
jgi:hypothetical protein